MNQIQPDQRARKRTSCSNRIELLFGEHRLPAELLNISFAGFQARLAPGSAGAALAALEAVRFEGLPAVSASVIWHHGETLGAAFDAPEKAGPVIAGFIELFVPPEG